MTVEAAEWWEMDWQSKACIKHFHQLDDSQTWFFTQSHRQLRWHQHQTSEHQHQTAGDCLNQIKHPQHHPFKPQPELQFIKLLNFFSLNQLVTLNLYSKAKPIWVAQPYESITGKLGKEACPLSVPFAPLLLHSFSYLVCSGVSHHTLPHLFSCQLHCMLSVLTLADIENITFLEP